MSISQKKQTQLPAAHLLGQKGEDVALAFLLDKGFMLLDRNWRYRQQGELDLVCKDQDCIVFVEVKTRRSSQRGGPEAAITVNKQRHLLKAAQAWLNIHRFWQANCRFDVVCLLGQKDNFQIAYYPHAFAVTTTLDRRHTSWQPW